MEITKELLLMPDFLILRLKEEKRLGSVLGEEEYDAIITKLIQGNILAMAVQEHLRDGEEWTRQELERALKNWYPGLCARSKEELGHDEMEERKHKDLF